MRIHVSMIAPVLLQVTTISAYAGVQNCGDEMRAKVLATATANNNSVVLNCNLALAETDVITKKLVFRGAESSGVTLNCNGATLKSVAGMDAGTRISVISRPPNKGIADDKWEPPENILIQKCVIEGAVRVSGMAVNGEDKSLTASSQREGHTDRVRANAPSAIVFNKNKFIGQGQIPIYFSPGVHHSQILNSRISGFSNSVVIYLDAESGDNIIKGNSISTETTIQQSSKDKARNAIYSVYLQVTGANNTPSLTGRELIAIDGSARNKIINNKFSNLDNGGIFLYRNCGEGGNIRHQTPHGNEIVNNIFYYDKYDGGLPAIWLASRNGNRSYCDLDKGYALGSSVSDLDYATNNFVAQNQFYKFEPSSIIRDNGENNYLEDNVRIEKPINRKAGCFYSEGRPSRLLADQSSMQYKNDPGLSSCSIRERTCEDGILSVRTIPCTTPKY